MKCYLTCCFILISINLFAQQVQWSSKILDFSTQFETDDFSAIKLLGPPDVPAEGGRHPAAWMAGSPDGKEFLAVGFDSAINVRQIAIFETFNPGAIYKVYLYDERNILHVIGTLEPKPANNQSRVLHILIDETPYKVNALRLIIDGSRVPGFNAIDAIGISNSSELIQKRKNFAYRTNPRLKTEEVNLNAAEEESDTRPVFSDRMKRLYFTRGYSSKNTGSKSDPGDIMVVIYSEANNSFTNPMYMGDEINNIGFNTSNGILMDGETEKLLIGNVTGNPSKVDANIVLVGKDEQGAWSSVEEQDIRKSGIFDLDVDYHITGDGKAMFLAAERKNSLGGRDIYVSLNTGKNKWSEPENLGAIINSVEDEYAPFFSMAENALYFASRGHGGMGGSDIFRVIRLDEGYTNWSEPENIGADINSEMDEKYFYFDDADESAYFARAKDDRVYGIFTVERPEFIDPNPGVTVKGRVTGGNQPVAAAISLFTVPENQMYAVTFSDETTGLYNILLRSGYDYQVVGEREGFKPVEMTLSLENRKTPYSYDLNLNLSEELIEESPELQDEIAAIREPAESPSQERAVVAPFPQVTAMAKNDESLKTTATEPEKLDPRSKADKLASLPRKEDESEGQQQEPPVSAETTSTGSGETKPAAGSGISTQTGPDKSEVIQPVESAAAMPDEPDPKQPSEPAEKRKNTKTEVSTESLVRFSFNSAELMPETMAILDAIAGFLQRHEMIKLEIGGFTDHIGDETYNMELGKRRAMAVKSYLTTSGIARNRIRIIGFGEKMPIVLSTDPDRLMTNRRVEFNFTK
ncbi:MAG: OmpA family protein [Cyclobacteriaceae bacterium]|nr:OmpA family protein [Cyclobacteriaceae bacterium]